MTSNPPLRALRVLLVLLALVAGAASALCLAYVAVDMADTTDEWHGLGIFLGLLGLVAVAPVLLLGLVALRLLRRPDPGRGLQLVLVVAVSAALASVLFGVAFPPALLGLAVAVPAALLAVAAGQERYSERAPSLAPIGQRR